MEAKSKKDVETDFQPKKKEFVTCFVPKCAVGRSYVQINRPLHAVMPLTPKANRNEQGPQNIDKHMKMLIVKGPKEKYEEPKTENQVYGWYEIEMKKDPLLFHGRKLDYMLQENLMNFAKIRK